MNVALTNRGSMSETFIKILRLFLTSNLTSQANSDSPFFFTFPEIQESKISEVKSMIDDGVSISGCCRFLSNIFNFDPALVNAIKNHQITAEESQMGKISSTIAWMGSEKYCTSDFFYLLVCTLMSDYDIISQFCLELMLLHYRNNIPKTLSSETVDLITQYFITNHDDVNSIFEILNSLLDISIKVRDYNISSNILRTILIIIQKNNTILANYDFKKIISTSEKLFQKLNIDSLSLLGGIASTTSSPDQFIEIFQKLAKIVISTFSEESTRITVKNLTPTSDFFSKFIIDYQLNFDSFKFFPQSTDVLPSSSFDSSMSVSRILEKHQFEVLKTFQAIFHFFNKNLQQLTLAFFKSFVDQLSSENKQNYQNVETFIFFLYLIQNIPKLTVPDTFCQIIIDSDIFCPKYTLFFSEKEDFQILNILRNLSLNFLYTSNPKMIYKLNSKLADYPFLLVENYSRLRTFLSVNDMTQFLNNLSIYDLTIVLKNLVSKMSEENLSEIERKHVFCAWSTLFVCINDFLNNSVSIVKLFQSLDFTSNYICHFFNPSLRPLIFSTLQRYMTMSKVPLSTVAQFCLYFFSIAIYNHDEKFHQLMTDLLACLEDAIVHNQEIVKELSVITPAILSFFLHFPTKELLKNTLNFLLLVSFNTNNFSFSHDEMLSLGNTIRTMDTDGLSEKNFSIILSLLAGTNISNMSQNFTIKNPSFILLVMYVSADDVSQTVQFFYRLCQYSIFNCVQCHKGMLDLLLIELVRNYPEPFKFLDSTFSSSFTRQDLLDVVIQFLALIFTYQCSPQSVERFIELAVPKLENEEMNLENNCDEGINLIKKSVFEKSTVEKSDIFSKFTRCNVSFPPFSDDVMNQVINTSSSMHDIHYVFTESATPIVYESIPLSEISNGFSFSCYLMVDLAVSQNNTQKHIIFKLFDTAGTYLMIYSSRSALLCEVNDVAIFKSSSVSLTTELASCQWSMVTLTLRKIPESDNKVNLIFSMNKDSKPPFTITDINFSGQYLTAQIGGFVDEFLTISDISCFLSSFYLYNSPLNSELVGILYSFGPKGIENNSNTKNLLETANLKSSESKNNVYLYIKPFSYIFREYNLVKLMIPFFGFSKFAPHFFLEKIVDSFRYVPLEQYEQYIPIISQFLMNSPPNVICYSLYLHFFMLFSEKQSSKLFKQILFNFNIWFNAEDPQTVKRVVQHWTNVLLPDFSAFFIENTTIPEILTLIRIHCWFTDEESNNIINHKRCPNIDVYVIRNCLNRLIAEFASYKLTMDDVRSILSNTFTTHDIQHKLSFLSLLDNISSLITDKNEVAAELHILFTTPRPDLFITTLNLILKLSDESRNSNSNLNSENLSHTDQTNVKLSTFSSYKPQSAGSLKGPNIRGKAASSMITTSPNQNAFFNSGSSLNSSSSSITLSNFVWTDNHIECILFHINKPHITVPILDAVLETSKTYPEALPIACMIACNLTIEEQLKTIDAFISILYFSGDEKVNEEFLNQKRAQKRLENLKTWFVWPIILTMKVKDSKEHYSMMLNTITSIIKGNYTIIDQILAFLDLIYIHYGTNVTTFQLEIVDNVCFSVKKGSKSDAKKIIYRFIRNLFFHYDRNIHSKELMKLFINSPYRNTSVKVSDYEFPFDISTMKDVQNLFKEQSAQNELIFRVDVDEENIDILKRIINNIDKLEIIQKSEENDNLSCYTLFFKYLKNRDSLSDSERANILKKFAHEGWRNFQAMNISFKMYMSTFCGDFEKFLIKIENTANDLLMNLNEESIEMSLTSIDVLNDRKISQYCQAANLFNRFESLEMTAFSIWKSFNERNCLTKKEERKSFYLLSDFSCPFTKKVFKLYNFEIDPFYENSKPILKKSALYVKLQFAERCTFAVLPKKIIIATKFKKIDIQIVDLTYILYRSFNCYEFMKKNGKTYLVDFLKTPIEDIIKAIKQVLGSNKKPVFQTSSFSKFIHMQNIANEWASRKITTFEYLLKLNFFGGRSYKMLHNYPVFPLIRDFSRPNNEEVKVSPQTWLRMFPPFSMIFDPNRSKTIDLSIKSKQVNTDLTVAPQNSNSNNNNNDILISSDDENVRFDETSTNSDNSNQNQDDEDASRSKKHRPSDMLSSLTISGQQKLFLEKMEDENASVNSAENDDPFTSAFQSSKYELTPEFFTMPECFSGLKLPPQFSSEFEFVYENRKRLESDEVSSSLNLWIDRLFGPTGTVDVLFKSPHPTRCPRPIRPQNQSKSSAQNYQIFLTISTENLIFGKIFLSNEKVVVKTVEVDGCYREHQVDITKQTVDTTSLIQFIYSPKTVFSSSGDVIYAADTENSVFSVINGSQIVKSQLSTTVDFSEPEGIFGSHGGFAFAVQPDSKNASQFLGEAKISPELIVTVTSSRKYDRTAVSVLSGKILVFERITGRLVSMIDTKGVPARRLLILEGLGLIVAEFPSELALFSAGGVKIRRMKLSYELFFMASYAAEDGLDLVFLSDKGGQITVLDAFTFGVVEKSSHSINSRIIDVMYVQQTACLLILTQDGKLFSFA